MFTEGNDITFHGYILIFKTITVSYSWLLNFKRKERNRK